VARGNEVRRRAAGLIRLVACLALMMSFLAGCRQGTAAASGSKTPVRLATLQGPTGVGMVHLMQAQQRGTASNDYTFTVSDSPDEVTAKVASGDVDIATIPTNLAAALYAKTSGGVQMLAVNTLGVMYVMENGDTINTMADLRGQTIYATGQGSNPEYVLRFLRQKNGIDPDKDVHLVFKSEHAELATLASAGQVKLALLPEPFVTTVRAKNPAMRVALDLTAEWAKVVKDGSQLMMGAVIARKDFITKSPGAVNAFLAEYKASITEATTDVDATANLCQQYGIIPSAVVAKEAIPRLSLTYVGGEGMVTGIQGYFQVLYAANPESVGGAIPDSGFYFPST
jgi:NitT/TauT family transport system substrate-binding protein